MRRAILGLTVVLALSAGAARADPISGDYETLKDTAMFKQYVYGVYAGLGWANAQLSNEKHGLLFCQPEELTLTADQLLSILDRYMEDPARKKAMPKDTSLASTTMLSLEHVFPCPVS